MPLYSYTTPTGETTTEFFHIGEKPESITLDDGTVAVYDFMATQQPTFKHPVDEGYPMNCEASGVHPDQISEFKKIGSEKGVDLKFTPDGRAVYDNKSHRDACLKARGFVDRSRYA